ncbi:hypothetical protein SO802_032591 [Lithocarpus litseifolius]|uniref:Uncharacterized protein n=1 Tax=Lithocarpus litseifolius TaxID=425828 RepID=A0AAW2BCP4_9ROSI
MRTVSASFLIPETVDIGRSGLESTPRKGLGFAERVPESEEACGEELREGVGAQCQYLYRRRFA